MKTTKMLTILVVALGLMVWPGQMARGDIFLTVNGQTLDSITLKEGQSCTVEVVSDDSNPYTAYVGFDNGVVLGDFTHVETKPEAGNLASVTDYNVPAFYGYYISAAGTAPAPSAGVHFVFQYQAQQLGETDLKLYDQTLTSVIDSVNITVVHAEMGTAFSYQGRLLDADSPADGLYDFEFELYDAPSDGNQLGNTTDINDLDVIDGHFVVELDFDGSAFDGNAVWLEIGVRAGELSDPNAYTPLSPRQEVTPAPYAIYAETANSDSDWMVSGNDMYSIPSGNVGIGTTGPSSKLDVNGDININSVYKIAGDTVLSALGAENTLVGIDAGANNTASYGTFVGYNAGYNNEGNHNTFLGRAAGRSNTTGNYNSAMGSGALYFNTTGYCNSAMGYSALLSNNTTGSFNSAMGYYALYYNTTGNYNSAMGSAALRYNTTGNDNSAVGYYANLFNQEGSRNTIIGYEAGRGTGPHSKSGNVFIGYRAGFNETGDNKLYIANGSADANVLIYGEFDTGNVGIGTTKPTDYDVAADDLVVYRAGDSGITIVSGVDSMGSIYFADGNSGVDTYRGFVQYKHGALEERLRFGANGAEVMSLYDGKVGIGTTSPGAKLEVNTSSGTAVYGENTDTGSYGKLGDGGYGVYCEGSSCGIAGFSDDGSGWNIGVLADATSTSSNNATALLSRVHRNGSGAYYSGEFSDFGSGGTYGGLYADYRTGDSIDLAEYILDTFADTEAGDVVIADPDNDESVLKSNKAFDSSVVGVISTQPHMVMGMELVRDEETGEMYEDVNAAQLTVAGRSPVKVTDENGPIQRGDLLTTSSKPGYAMKWSLLNVNQAEDFEELKSMLAENERRHHSILGKALGSHESSDGKIIALLSLQ